MRVEVKASSISYCPVYDMHVLTLRTKDEGLWLPVFLRNEDSAFLQGLLQRTAVTPLRGVRDILDKGNGAVMSSVLHSVTHQPFLATVTVVWREHKREDIEMPYVEAIAVAIQTGVPIFIDRDIMMRTSVVVEAERSKVSKELKDYLDKRMRPRRSREALKEKLEEAIQLEDFELAALIRDELGILNATIPDKPQ